ncbi:MAG TPA: hypothetical protein VM576_02300 [Xanthomonadaceae bacterium]|nr:hypothetical protein [Xanthomonadaceae bacterium]
MNAIDWPDLVAGTGILESLDAAGADCRVPAHAATASPDAGSACPRSDAGG